MDAIFAIFRALGELISIFFRFLVIILDFVEEVSQRSNSGTAPSNTTNYNTGSPALVNAQRPEGLFEVYTNQSDRRVWVVCVECRHINNIYFRTRVKIRMNGDLQDKYYTYEFKLFNNKWAYFTAKGAWAPVEGTVTANAILMGLHQYFKIDNCIE